MFLTEHTEFTEKGESRSDLADIFLALSEKNIGHILREL